jgi:hypothetical protein
MGSCPALHFVQTITLIIFCFIHIFIKYLEIKRKSVLMIDFWSGVSFISDCTKAVLEKQG